jgi:hypothetical protein
MQHGAPLREAHDLGRSRRFGDEMATKLGFGDHELEDGREVEEHLSAVESLLGRAYDSIASSAWTKNYGRTLR